MKILIAIPMLALAGCGIQFPPTPTPDISADAGADTVVAPFDTVVLDGTASLGGNTFLWEQVSGPTVELLDANSVVAVFDAPGMDAVLVFTLIVSSGAVMDFDAVTVIVEGTVAECFFDQGDEMTHLLILDWTGDGEPSPFGFGPDIPIPPFDFSSHPLPGGGTLADDPAGFMADVLAKVAADIGMISVFSRNHLPAEEFLVLNGEYDSGDTSGRTIMFVTDWQEPDNPLVLGRAVFDSSDKRWDDGGFVYGVTFSLIAVESPTYEQCVNAFADVVVHELGHTLGFGHSEDSDVPLGAEPRMGIMRGTREAAWFLEDHVWLVDQMTWQDTDFFPGCGRWEMDPAITFLDEIESDKMLRGTEVLGDLRCGVFGGLPFEPTEENEAIVNLP